MTDLTPDTDPFRRTAAEQRQADDRQALNKLAISRTAMAMALSIAHREIISATTLRRLPGEVLERWAGSLHLLDVVHRSLDSDVSAAIAALRAWHHPR